MPVTMQQVLAELDRDEPDYGAVSALGREALPHLAMVVGADDPLRAAKAAYAASLIGGDGSVDLLRRAAGHRDPQVRVAVAHGLRNAGEAAPTEVLANLLGDEDVGVRKVALGTTGDLGRGELHAAVASMASNDADQNLRDAAVQVARNIE